jgi:hypothetical protein
MWRIAHYRLPKFQRIQWVRVPQLLAGRLRHSKRIFRALRNHLAFMLGHGGKDMDRKPVGPRRSPLRLCFRRQRAMPVADSAEQRLCQTTNAISVFVLVYSIFIGAKKWGYVRGLYAVAAPMAGLVQNSRFCGMLSISLGSLCDSASAMPWAAETNPHHDFLC